MTPPAPRELIAAQPPPLPPAGEVALQFANLTANYVASVRRIVNLSAGAQADATHRALTRMASTDAFSTIQMMFANNTPFSSLLRALNTLSINATHAAHAGAAPAPPYNPAENATSSATTGAASAND